MDKLCAGLNNLAQTIFRNNQDKGFWDKPRNTGEMLMLAVSELGEAMEADRKRRYSDLKEWEKYEGMDHSTKEWKEGFEKHMKDTFEDEIADTIIRLLDMSEGLGIDIEKQISSKLKYNTTRERLHGKSY